MVLLLDFPAGGVHNVTKVTHNVAQYPAPCCLILFDYTPLLPSKGKQGHPRILITYQRVQDALDFLVGNSVAMQK
jgi:hypothetical protein